MAGLASATALAVILAPVVAAQGLRDWAPAVSVDPERLQGVNSHVNDGCPAEAPDSQMLFFASNRVPGAAGTKDLDIWIAYRGAEGPWQSAEPLPAPVNSSAAEFCPTPLPGNLLLFVSTRTNTCGSGNDPDIYVTWLRMSPSVGWAEPSALPCDNYAGINSAYEEFSPSLVQVSGRTFLFFSSNRDTGLPGVHKVYSSELLGTGSWVPARAIESLNAEGFSTARPNVRADGLEIVFDSNRAGTYDVFTATRGRLDAQWSSPRRLGPNVNSDTADETRPSLSPDGWRLYFGSTRANAELGGSGGDLYVSTRVNAHLAFPRRQ
jgi:hypothetical protein